MRWGVGSQTGKVLEGPGEERSVGPVPRTVSKEGLGRGELSRCTRRTHSCGMSKKTQVQSGMARRRCFWGLVMERQAGGGPPDCYAIRDSPLISNPAPVGFLESTERFRGPGFRSTGRIPPPHISTLDQEVFNKYLNSIKSPQPRASLEHLEALAVQSLHSFVHSADVY